MVFYVNKNRLLFKNFKCVHAINQKSHNFFGHLRSRDFKKCQNRPRAIFLKFITIIHFI